MGIYSYNAVPARKRAGVALEVKRSFPARLKPVAQVNTFTLSVAAAVDVTITATDQESGQAWELTATLPDNVVANGIAALTTVYNLGGKFRDLFSIVATSSTIAFASRNADHVFTFSLTLGAGVTASVTETTAASVSALQFGRLVARGDSSYEFKQVTSSTTAKQLMGALKRTDGNHYQDIPASTDDVCEVGRKLPIVAQGTLWMQCSGAVTVGGDVYVVVEGSDLGTLRATPTGDAHTATLTFVADRNAYGYAFNYLGKHYEVLWVPTDATNTAAAAAAAVKARHDLQAIAGTTFTDNMDGTASLSAAAGTVLEDFKLFVGSLDANANGLTASVVSGPDPDALNVSDYLTIIEPASAGELALVRVNLP